MCSFRPGLFEREFWRVRSTEQARDRLTLDGSCTDESGNKSSHVRTSACALLRLISSAMKVMTLASDVIRLGQGGVAV